MNQIKYRYCLDENNKIIHISSVSVENRHGHTYHCPVCGEVMVPKLGDIRERHFAHKTNIICNGESYLHWLAKERIYRKFKEGKEFYLTIKKQTACKKNTECANYLGYSCKINNNSSYNLKEDYDFYEKEKQIGGFRPDLYISNVSNPCIQPIFIEIYKTHKSESSKIKSKNIVIETKKIETEEDIEDIINRGFIDGDNCKIYNFKERYECFEKDPLIKELSTKIIRHSPTQETRPRSLTVEEINKLIKTRGSEEKTTYFLWVTPENYNNDVINQQSEYIIRFILFADCNGIILRIGKDKSNTPQYPTSIGELNFSYKDNYRDCIHDYIQKGLVYFIKKGYKIKNCLICSNYYRCKQLKTVFQLSFQNCSEYKTYNIKEIEL